MTTQSNAVHDLIDQPLVPIIEAALFAADQPLSVAELIRLFSDSAPPSKEDVLAAITTLQDACEGRGVELVQVASGYRYRTREAYATWVGRMFQKRPQRLSRAALETLAIITYRQPVTRGDIEEIRGVSVSTETIRALMEKEWVRELGQREVPGRPTLYGTSKGFLDFFGLTSLRELPALDDRRELEDIAREMNIELWPDEDDANPAEGAENTADGASSEDEMDDIRDENEHYDARLDQAGDAEEAMDEDEDDTAAIDIDDQTKSHSNVDDHDE